MKIIQTLKGSRTYIMALLAIAYGVSSYFLGHIEAEVAINTIWAGITTLTMRSAIK